MITHITDNSFCNRKDIPEQGVNIINGKEIIIKDASGHTLSPLWNFDKKLITQNSVYQHVDIMGEMPVTLSVDMLEQIDVSSIVIGGAYSRNGDLCTSEYEIYLSVDEVTLFSEANKIVHYNNDGAWDRTQIGKGSLQLFTFEDSVCGRFIGVKILKSNPTDGIIRFARLEVYSKKYNQQHSVLKSLGENILSQATLREVKFEENGIRSRNIWPLYGEWNDIVDGVFGNPLKMIKIGLGNSPACFTYSLKEGSTPSFAVISGLSKNVPDIKLFVSDNEELLFESPIEITNKTVKYEFENEWTACFETDSSNSVKYFGVRIAPESLDDCIILDQIALIDSVNKVDVITEEHLNEDYFGNGANIVPFNLMKSNTGIGFTKAHFARDVSNMATIKPSIVRIWAQIDWMEKEKGIYDFDTQEMDALVEYASALKEIGTEIELTFSWKVGAAAQSWYSIPGVEAVNSAPRDLEAYAESCCKLYEYFWSKGLDNVKYLSVANEPGGCGDFQCVGDPKKYFSDTIRVLDRKLREKGIRDKVKIWGPEASEGIEYTELCANSLSDCIDCYTQHWYMPTPEEVYKKTKYLIDIGASPFMITECWENDDGAKAWGRSLAGYVINCANAGGSGVVMWTMHGIKSMSDYKTNSWPLEGHQNLWWSQLNGGKYNYIYYDFGLLCRYIPAHSKTLKIVNNSADMRIAAFETADGEYTIVTETKKTDAPRALRFNFDKSVNKTFYKLSYVPATDDIPEMCGILPSVSKEIKCSDFLYDENVTKEYSVSVYTTVKPALQVKISQVFANLKAGEQLKLEADIIDGEDKIIWSVKEGRGKISENGLFTAPSDASAGEVYAIKAECASDNTAYNICIVTII